MSIFSRLGDIINANLNAMLDRAEDPEKIVRLIIQEMEDTLVEARSAAARSIAEKKELARRIEHMEAAEADWQRKAELAITRDREDLARGALLAKSEAARTIDLMRKEMSLVDETLAKTHDDLARLDAKLAEAKAKQKSFDLRHKAARDQHRIRTQLHDGRIDDAMARYEQVERKLDRMEGEVEAFDLGRRRKLAEEFAELEAESAISEELEALKARLGRK